MKLLIWWMECFQTESKFEPFIICANLIARLFVLIPPPTTTTPYVRVRLLFPIESLSFSSHFYAFMNQIHETVSAFPSTLYTTATKMCLSFFSTYYILFSVKNVMWLSCLVFVLSKSILDLRLLWSSVFSKEVEEELIGPGIPEPSD